MAREFTWCVNAGAAQDTELKTNVTQFGDGYEQVSSFGINNARLTAQYSVTDYLHVINDVHDFLVEHAGVIPFIMTVANETKTYRTDGTISKNHLGADVWQISFTVKQVFTP